MDLQMERFLIGRIKGGFMVLEIKITSENKGSNPGGRCMLDLDSHKGFDLSGKFYLKYCSVNGIYSNSLTPSHQPFYEAMFIEMARILGLIVPDYFVLINSSPSKILFSYLPEKDEKPKKLNPYNKTFFISKIVDEPPISNDLVLGYLMNSERIYRDVLNLGDVSGRANNYSLIFSKKNLKHNILYLDLGCSLVDAKDGVLLIRKGLERKLTNLKNKKLKYIVQKLKKTNLKVLNNENFINLGILGDKILNSVYVNILEPSFSFKINRILLNKVVNLSELEELTKIYFLVNMDFLEKYKNDPRVFLS